MTIFVGLGNHETKYHNTKHNVGYWVLDSFAKRYGLEFKPGKGNYFVAKKGSSFMLIKPTTGMNNSCLLYTSPSPRDRTRYRMPSSA